ncbi:MAG: hypothetical protein QXR30_04970, partial [Candidatus Woesearchaeota archaeon]
MRILLIFILVLSFAFQINAQKIIENYQTGYLIKFETQPEVFTKNTESDLKNLDFIYYTDESRPGFPKLPSKLMYIAIPPNSEVYAIIEKLYQSEFSDVLVETNPRVELNDDTVLVYKKTNYKDVLFDEPFYPKEEIELVNYTWIRDFYVAAIRINTHRYSLNNKKLIVIDSLYFRVNFSQYSTRHQVNNSPLSIYDEMLRDVILNFDDALKFRSFNPNFALQDTTGSWIDFTKEYLKLAIPAHNIYRITYNDLVSFGINPALINPKTFKLFVRGKEQPIFVAGENDNSFDTTDYIEFYAERNYTYQDYRQIVNIGEDYIQFMNRYSDTTIAWLTWDGLLGRRIETINVNPIQTSDTVSSHQVKLHLEQDVRLWYYDPTVPRVQLPFWQENKTWTWLVVGNSGSTSISFNAREFLENTPVRIIARLISYASSGTINAHKHGLSLNRTTPQDTITYNYKQTVNLSGNYNS